VEGVVHDRENRKVYTLNSTSWFLYQRCDCARTREELRRALQEEFDCDEQSAREGVERFLEQARPLLEEQACQPSD